MEDGLQSGDTVYCMPIRESNNHFRSARGCVILKINGNGQSGVYEQIGFFILVKENPEVDEAEKKKTRVSTMRGHRIENQAKNYRHAFQQNPNTERCITLI